MHLIRMSYPGVPCYWDESGAKLVGAKIVQILAEEEGLQLADISEIPWKVDHRQLDRYPSMDVIRWFVPTQIKSVHCTIISGLLNIYFQPCKV